MDLIVVMLSESLTASTCLCAPELLTARFGRLNALAQSCDEGIGLLKNAMQILEFNVVSSSIIINCRDMFRCAAKLDWEWGTIKMRSFHHVVDVVDDHTRSCDQQETKNRVHIHLGSGGNDKRDWASISGEIWQVKLECHG